MCRKLALKKIFLAIDLIFPITRAEFGLRSAILESCSKILYIRIFLCYSFAKKLLVPFKICTYLWFNTQEIKCKKILNTKTGK